MEIIYKHINGDKHYRNLDSNRLNYMQTNPMFQLGFIYIFYSVYIISSVGEIGDIGLYIWLGFTGIFAIVLLSVRMIHKKLGFIGKKGETKVIIRKGRVTEVYNNRILGTIKIKEIEVSEKFIRLYKKDHIYICIPLRVLNEEQKMQIIDLLDIKDINVRDRIYSYEA